MCSICGKLSKDEQTCDKSCDSVLSLFSNQLNDKRSFQISAIFKRISFFIKCFFDCLSFLAGLFNCNILSVCSISRCYAFKNILFKQMIISGLLSVLSFLPSLWWFFWSCALFPWYGSRDARLKNVNMFSLSHLLQHFKHSIAEYSTIKQPNQTTHLPN